MKAVILVGGEGTRMRPLTCNTPKPMVPIINKPFLEHMIAYLKKHGIDDIVLSMCYLPDRIRSYFGDGAGFGVKLTYVVEETPLGTAGGVKNVEDHLDDNAFFVFNGDILTDLDLTAMWNSHTEREASVSIALTPVEDPTAYGIVETENDGMVKRFIEKPSWDAVTTNMINAGTYILNANVLRHVPRNEHFMFERGLFPLLVQMGDPVFGYPSDAYWIDIGTPQKYMKVHHDLLHGRVATVFPGKQVAEGVWVGNGTTIDPSARLAGPIVIGDNCTIGGNTRIVGPVILGSGCKIGNEVEIEDAVIWKETRIGNHVTIKTCVLAERNTIADNVFAINGCVTGDNVTIGSGNRLDAGIRVWPDRNIEANTITF